MRRRPRPRRGLHGRPAPVAASPPPPFPSITTLRAAGTVGPTDRKAATHACPPSALRHPPPAARRMQQAGERPPAEPRQRPDKPPPTSAGYDGRTGPKTAQKRAAMARMRSPRNGTGPAAIAAQIGRKMSYIIPIENYITSPSPYVRRDRRWSWLLPLLHPCPHRSGAIRSQTVTVPAD